MSGTPSEKRCRIVPESDLKCVWMTAGILSYQLCERQFDCEHCPLDQAMRMHFTRGETSTGAPSAGERGTPRLAEDRRYSRGHCWLRRGEPRGAGAALHRVGIEPGLAVALQAPRAVVTPVVGEEIRRGQAHLWFVTEGGTFALGAPIDGVVRAVNPALVRRPAAVSSSPLEEGWLYDVEVPDASPQLSTLLDAAAAEPAYTADARRFQHALARALGDPASSPGPTLSDGGAALDSVVHMLGPQKYFSVLCKAYG